LKFEEQPEFELLATEQLAECMALGYLGQLLLFGKPEDWPIDGSSDKWEAMHGLLHTASLRYQIEAERVRETRNIWGGRTIQERDDDARETLADLRERYAEIADGFPGVPTVSHFASVLRGLHTKVVYELFRQSGLWLNLVCDQPGAGMALDGRIQVKFIEARKPIEFVFEEGGTEPTVIDYRLLLDSFTGLRGTFKIDRAAARKVMKEVSSLCDGINGVLFQKSPALYVSALAHVRERIESLEDYIRREGRSAGFSKTRPFKILSEPEKRRVILYFMTESTEAPPHEIGKDYSMMNGLEQMMKGREVTADVARARRELWMFEKRLGKFDEWIHLNIITRIMSDFSKLTEIPKAAFTI